MSIFFDKRGDLVIGNAHISCRNFSGNRFGVGGSKGFCVSIEDPDFAQRLADEGWNVKIKQNPKDPDDEPYIYIPVAVNYNERFHPNIYMYTGRNRVCMENNTVATLDNADLEKIDLIIHGRKREDPTTHEVRVKAFLKTGHFTLEDDPFADDYADYMQNGVNNDDQVPFDA